MHSETEASHEFIIMCLLFHKTTKNETSQTRNPNKLK